LAIVRMTRVSMVSAKWLAAKASRRPNTDTHCRAADSSGLWHQCTQTATAVPATEASDITGDDDGAGAALALEPSPM
jgi:hypothetical protein